MVLLERALVHRGGPMQVEIPKIRGVSYNNDASFRYDKLQLS